ncbi:MULTISPECIES: T9SS type A sorting domain-containing protein [Antarcticibacterium]|nr:MULTISPECIES: T9SS type A sorting domain-containing protein [Antarcticibacterium]
MRQIYIIAFLLLPFYGISQLHIQPRGSEPAFIYSEGELLFVQKNIHTKANPGGIASIYLRKEAQLLQGSQNMPNTGDGKLSVFQEGTASAYSYNYWASPVQSISPHPSFGEILYEPLTTLESQKAIITTGLDGQAQPLTISSRWVYTLDGSNYGDWQFAGNTFDIQPGEGFTMKGVNGKNLNVSLYGVPNNPGNAQRYDFRGRPNSGLFPLQIKKDEIKLVGNPYPSALDLNAFLTDNTNITGIAYFWDSKEVNSHYLQDYQGGYGAYSPAAGNNGYVPAVFYSYDQAGNPLQETGATGGNYARRFSPIGQGFIVEGAQNGAFFFRNEYRVFQKEAPRVSQFKTTANNNEPEHTTSIIRFNVKFPSYTRQLLLALREDSTPGFDLAMDARNLTPLVTDAGWWLQDEAFLIDVRPHQEAAEIPILLDIADSSMVSVEISEKENFRLPLFLLDKEMQVYHDLQAGAAVLFPEQGTHLERFFITFNAGEAAGEELPPVGPNLVNIFQNNREKRLEIRIEPQFTAERIRLFDISGKRIFEIQGEKGTTTYELRTDNLVKGVYIVKIKSIDDTVISKKVIISN